MKPTILFINPPTPGFRKITRNCDCASESKGNYLLQPFDFLYLTSKIAPEFEFTFIDCVANSYTLDQTIEQVQTLRPTHIVTAIVDLCWESDFEFLKTLRSLFPESYLFAFGDVLVEESNRLQVLEFADGVIDDAFLFDLSQTFCPKEQLNIEQIRGVSNTPTRPRTDKSPRPAYFPFIPNHKAIQHQNYRWPFSRHLTYTSIATNWGCPYSCSYCIDSLFPFHFRPAEELYLELKTLRDLGIKELVITDKSFGQPRENTLKFLESMKDFSFSWSTYIHPKQCDQKLMTAMKEAGCHTIIIGIESDKSDHLKLYNRNTNKQTIAEAIFNARKVDLDICGDFIIGLPNQTYQDALDVITYSLTLDISYASFNIAAPLPGSSIKQMALQEGRMSQSDHHYDSVGNIRVLPTLHLSAKELKKLRAMANRRFYLRPKILWQRFKRTQSIEHFHLQFLEGLQLFLK